MKITKSRLKQIIKEEISTYQEGGGEESVPGTDLGSVITDLVFSASALKKREVVEELMKALPMVGVDAKDLLARLKRVGDEDPRTSMNDLELGVAIEKAMRLATQAKRIGIDNILEKAHQTLMGI